MRILVALHTLALGGSPITAIDLATGARRHGHDVAIYGVPGPLTDYVRENELPFVPARPLRYRPAPSRIVQLAALARRERLDLIHSYEWPPCLDAYFGPHLVAGTPLVCTVYSMDVPPYVPESVPLIMGTPALRDEAQDRGFDAAWLLEPPIDTRRDHPGYRGRNLRHELGIAPDEPLVVCTSRLALNAKLESLVEAIDAVDLLAEQLPVRFLIIGEGDASEPLAERAAAVNRRWGRAVVVLPGPDPEPRPAYAAADVVVGMGTSILRGLAFGKPAIVQGERGFAQTFTPETSAMFLHQGMWGLGDGTSAVPRMAEQLRVLLTDPGRRADLGAYGRRIVEERFALESAVDRQLELYERALARRVVRHPVEAAQMLGRAARLEWQLHDPRRKRERSLTAHERFEATRCLPETGQAAT